MEFLKIMMAGLIAGCERDESSQRSSQRSSQNESSGVDIIAVQASLARVRMNLEQSPWLEMIFSTTRDYLILRQVELSQEPMDRKTQKDLTDAKTRAANARHVISKFYPVLDRLERDLLDLQGALYWFMQSKDMSQELSAALGQCRSLIYELLEGLRLAKQVIAEPDSVVPRNSKYYAPDFHGTLTMVDEVLWEVSDYEISKDGNH